MTGNTISNNNRRGVNLLITGAAGTRDREFGASLFDPTLITLTDNTITSNGEEGIYFRGDSQMNQSRYTSLANFPFPDPPFNPANDRPRFGFFYFAVNPMLYKDFFQACRMNTDRALAEIFLPIPVIAGAPK